MLEKFIGINRRLLPFNAPIVIVSGLPRSGTSMMMKMLVAGGMPSLTDQIRSADIDNPQGYFEFERVKQLDKADALWLAEARGKAVKIVSTFLSFLPDQYQYRILFMQRDIDEILASQDKMIARRGEQADSSTHDAIKRQFHQHLVTTQAWLQTKKNIAVQYIRYDGVVQNPQFFAERVARFLQRPVDTKAMVQSVNPDLYRNKNQTNTIG